MDKHGLGKLGEQIAVDYLQNHNYEIIGRNFRTRYGEIDIVARDGRTLVFIEVKSRSSVKFGTPEESITHDKRNKLRLMSAYFLSKNKLQHQSHRLDVIGIIFEGSKARLRHHMNVIGS